MKKVLSLLLSILIILGAVSTSPFVFANDTELQKGYLHANGTIYGSTGYIEIFFTLPEQDEDIYSIQFNYTLPSGVALNGSPTTPLKTTNGTPWEIGYSNKEIWIYNSHNQPLNDVNATVGREYTVVKIPVKITKDIAPGRLDFKAELTEVGIKVNGENYGYDNGIGFFDKEVDAYVEYIKNLGGATVSGISQMTYSGKSLYQNNITVKLGNTVLEEGTDYDLEHSNNKLPGVATVKIVGCGSYYGTISKTFIIIPTKVSDLKAGNSTVATVSFSWKKAEGVSGYSIHRSLSANSGYSQIAEVTTNSFTDNNLYSGKYYYYRVYAFKTINGKKYYSGYSAVRTKTTGYLVNTPQSLKASSQTTSSVKISWKVTSNANGYIVYRSTNKNSGYKAIKTINSQYTTYFVNKKLSKGKTYYYKVYAYRTYKGSKGIGAPASITTSTKPTTPKISSAKNSAKKTAKVTWKKATGASRYELYFSTKKTKGYKKAYTGTKLSYTKKSLKKGKTYYFKVRAYRTVNGKKIYGSYSSPKSVKIKK